MENNWFVTLVALSKLGGTWVLWSGSGCWPGCGLCCPARCLRNPDPGSRCKVVCRCRPAGRRTSESRFSLRLLPPLWNTSTCAVTNCCPTHEVSSPRSGSLWSLVKDVLLTPRRSCRRASWWLPWLWCWAWTWGPASAGCAGSSWRSPCRCPCRQRGPGTPQL